METCSCYIFAAPAQNVRMPNRRKNWTGIDLDRLVGAKKKLGKHKKKKKYILFYFIFFNMKERNLRSFKTNEKKREREKWQKHKTHRLG